MPPYVALRRHGHHMHVRRLTTWPHHPGALLGLQESNQLDSMERVGPTNGVLYSRCAYGILCAARLCEKGTCADGGR